MIFGNYWQFISSDSMHCMLYDLPIEIVYLILNKLSCEEVIVLGLINKEYYLHLLDPVKSKNLYYKSLSKPGLSKIKLDIKLKQIVNNARNFVNLKFQLANEFGDDLYSREFKNISKKNLDNFCDILKANNNNMVAADRNNDILCMTPNMYVYARLMKNGFVYKICMRGEKNTLSLSTCARCLMLVLDDRIYIYCRDVSVTDANIIFQTAYYKYEYGSSRDEFKYVNYNLKIDNGSVLLDSCTKAHKLFWYVTDTETYHIIGISTINGNHTNLDIFLINKHLLDDSLTNILEIDLTDEPFYRIKIQSNVHPQRVDSNFSTGESSKIWVFVCLANRKVIIHVFDIFTKHFHANPLKVKFMHGRSYKTVTFNIIDDEYLLVIERNDRIYVHWIDIRREQLKLDSISNYSLGRFYGMTIFQDGILVKDKGVSCYSKQTYSYTFY